MADLLSENQIDDPDVAHNSPADPNSGLAASPKPGDEIAPTDGPQHEVGSPLFPSAQCQSLGDEWQSIQAGFVDEPRASVQKADALVKKTVGILESSFAEMHNSLERNWEKDKEVSTEDLRVALQNYRSFFQRLLSV